MTILAISLLTLSAFIHASWNLIGKRAGSTTVFFFIATFSSALVFLPVLFIFRNDLKEVPSEFWLLLALSGIFQAIYYISLAEAYRNGDLIVAYPLVRALPVLMIAFVSLVLGRGERLTYWGFLGMILIALGCLALPLRSFQAAHLRQYWQRIHLLAVLAAIGTTGYTIIDDTSLRLLRGLPEVKLENLQVAFLYIELETIAAAITLLAVTVIHPIERLEWQLLRKYSWTQAATSGILITAAYLLVLISMAYVRDVSYVSAFRQLSIPFGALFGIFIQKEKPYPPTIAGITCITTGLILVGIG